MRVAAIQSDIVWESPADNFVRLRPWLSAAAAAGCRVAVLPEMYACGFSMQTDVIAEPPDGPSTSFLRDQAHALRMWVGGSIPERPSDSDRPYNTFLLAGPAGELVRYRKIHPFTFAGEHEHYAAGQDFTTIDIDGVRCTLFVCYDLRFADEFWHTANRTDAYFVIANWPERRRHHFMALLHARAIENQAYVVGVNRIGTGGQISYVGDSRIIDPWGEALATAATDETMLVSQLDAARVHDARARFPVLADRR